MAAATSIMINGGRRPIASSKVMFLGALRTLRTIKVMYGGVLRTVANFVPPLAASSSGVEGYGDSVAPVTISAGPAVCVASGGLAPFTYAWSYQAGDVFALSDPTSAGTFFTRNAVPRHVTFSALYRCTVTDAIGQSAFVDVPALVRNAYGEDIS